MNKQELIAAIAEQADLSKASAGNALNANTDTITAALAKGDAVTFVGFGTFSVKDRAARTGRNPQTKVPGFKAGKALKDACNG